MTHASLASLFTYRTSKRRPAIKGKIREREKKNYITYFMYLTLGRTLYIIALV